MGRGGFGEKDRLQLGLAKSWRPRCKGKRGAEGQGRDRDLVLGARHMVLQAKPCPHCCFPWLTFQAEGTTVPTYWVSRVYKQPPAEKVDSPWRQMNSNSVCQKLSQLSWFQKPSRAREDEKAAPTTTLSSKNSGQPTVIQNTGLQRPLREKSITAYRAAWKS